MTAFYNERSLRTEPYVYFMRATNGGGAIKIGCSIWPEGRLASCSSWSPLPLEIIARSPGDKNLEALLHGYFDASRSHNEWFHPTDKLLRLIAKVNAGTALRDAIDLSGVSPRGAGRSPNAKIKQGLMVRLTAAERRAGISIMWPREPNRPAHLNDAVGAWRASFFCAALDGPRSVIEAYIASLSQGAPDPIGSPAAPAETPGGVCPPPFQHPAGLCLTNERN